MIKFDFKINKDALNPNTYINTYIDRIKKIQDKRFTVKVGQNTYTIRYKVNGTCIDLYSNSNTSITKPVVKLNLGDLLLPEYISVSKNYEPYDYTVIMEEGKGLSNKEIEQIMAEIGKIGLLKLIFS